jgi:Zn-finger protein
MNNSNRFFANRDCEYYPCHEGIEEMNCLFCYCPLYHLESCPGKPSFRERNGRIIKVCTACTFPHRPENYDMLISCLKENIGKTTENK